MTETRQESPGPEQQATASCSKQYVLDPSLTRFFPPAHPREVALGYALRDIARVFFELLRNLLVVGAFKVAANATGSAVLDGIYTFSLMMLLWLFYSFIVQVDVRLCEHFTQRPFAKWIDAWFSLFFAGALWLGCWWLINYTAAEVAAVKSH